MNTTHLIFAVLLIGVAYYIGTDMGLFVDPVESALESHRDLMDRFNARN